MTKYSIDNGSPRRDVAKWEMIISNAGQDKM